VEELNYYKNTSARLLVRGQSDLMCLIISDIENPFFADLIKSYERACAARQLEVLLCATNYDLLQAHAAVRRMIENRVRGVAVMISQFHGSMSHIAQMLNCLRGAFLTRAQWDGWLRRQPLSRVAFA
jgi:DNA-binding LacI/PurR family transcriptional regulator